MAFVHDAVLVATKALETALASNDSLFHQNFRHGQLYNRGFRGIYCHPSEDMESPERPFTTFEHGKRIAKALRNVRYISSLYIYIAPSSPDHLQTRLSVEDGTLTGTIQFDKYGFRKNFEVTVIDLVSSEKSAFNQKEVSENNFPSAMLTYFFQQTLRYCRGNKDADYNKMQLARNTRERRWIRTFEKKCAS